MAAPASEDLRELQRLLTIAFETGEWRTAGSLCEELQIERDQMTVALDLLRENGKAVEAAPGEWRAPADDEMRGPAPVPVPEPVRVPDAPEDGEEAATARMRDLGRVLPRPMYAAAVGGSAMRLTKAFVDALSPDALGQAVKAGIEEAKARDETFVLEVEP